MDRVKQGELAVNENEEHKHGKKHLLNKKKIYIYI